ncbi:hypothetical protein BUALT_Bualt08G0082900 [Buddleja alternifolia]|uniref:Uncharacterized protein n=1 Tax=Buddleja alternifolia TaxID=168488 RepID=A0AAV6XD34_9LAMI|nr:hypothetical protein BUALT_Bualt08G0082900 [Buddleja alternifolia]
MKLLERFRKIIMRFILPGFPSRGGGSPASESGHAAAPRRRSCDRTVEPPKTSCSSYSYYSSNSHYNEAIADCIEFFNKSSQDGVFNGRKSDVMMV